MRTTGAATSAAKLNRLSGFADRGGKILVEDGKWISIDEWKRSIDEGFSFAMMGLGRLKRKTKERSSSQLTAQASPE